LVDVSVRYGDHEILRNLNWSIRRGEHWWLRGGNGRGKSTLLSLLYGDNPQAYANEIYLFDRRRGSGESIWELKSRIGYTSPELQRYAEDMGYLSTGERSLKSLQRVLSVRYDLLILDEPLQGLDMSSRELAKGLINRYCADADVTLIYVAHDQREVPGSVTLVKEL
jgi:molybdate transport system ATP-binding protein